MISSREEYLYVAVPGEIRVDGGIMPARDAAGDGSWRALRGEDPAFLLEGLAERRAALGLAVSPAAMDRALRASRLAGVADGLRALAARRAAPRFVRPPEAAPVHGAEAYGFDDFYPDARISAADLASSAGDFAAGSPLRADPVRALFRDMQLLRSFLSGGAAAIDCTAWDLVRSAYDESTDYGRPESPAVYKYCMEMEREADGEPMWKSQSLEWRLSAGSFSAALDGASASGLVASCRAFGAFSAAHSRYRRATSAGKVEEASFSAVPLPCAVSGGVASVAAADVLAAAAAVVAHHGWEKVPWNQQEYGSQTIAVYLREIYAVWTLGPHTDISPLGWTWEPGASGSEG